MVKVVPELPSDDADTVPPWAATSSRTTASPIPDAGAVAVRRAPPQPVEHPVEIVGGDAGTGVGTP